jgi:hypothetical protein
LATLVWFSAVLVATELVLPKPPRGAATRWLWHAQSLGPGAEVALFVGALAIAIGQRQYANLNRAFLRIESDWWHGSGRRITLRNNGKGLAKILKVWFEVGSTLEASENALSLERLKEYLDTFSGLLDGTDYDITNFTRGATIAPHTSEMFAECGALAVAKLDRLEFVVRYESAGDVYEKRGSLLPYPGASDPVA